MMYAKLFIQEKFRINNTGTALIKKKNLLLTGWNRPLFYKSKLLQNISVTEIPVFCCFSIEQVVVP